MWKVYGNVLLTSEIDGTDKSQAMRIRPNSNRVLRALRTWFIFYNAPVFTQLRLRIYEDQNGSAGKLIATSSNYFAPADCFTDPYAHKGLYFEFGDISIKSTNWYHILPYATGYTGNDSTHIAWSKGFPDPEYTTGLTIDFESMHVMPYRLSLVGAPL